MDAPVKARSTDRDVFINCPFDPDYKQYQDAIIFTICDCGFSPRSAWESECVGVGGRGRFERICDLILHSPYSIHDLSRIELDKKTGLPRFNMALELGVFLGVNFALEGMRECLVIDIEPYRYQQFCSDLNLYDPSAYRGDVETLITLVRNYLRQCLERMESDEKIPGGEYIFERYKRFLIAFPDLCAKAKLVPASLMYIDYLSFVKGWVKGKRLRKARTS